MARTRRVSIRRVVDGDSVEVRYAGLFSFLRRPFPVRLYAIDAPELAQPFGAESRAQLASLLGGGRIRLAVVNRDRYGRQVGLLYRRRRGRQELVNLTMVQSGMAYWYQRYGGRELGFPEAQAHAKRRRLGVWQGGNRRQRPWDYRADQRRGRRRGFPLRRLLWWTAAVLVIAAAAAFYAFWNGWLE